MELSDPDDEGSQWTPVVGKLDEFLFIDLTGILHNEIYSFRDPIQFSQLFLTQDLVDSINEGSNSRTAQSGFILQQDNDSKHKLELLTEWFHDNNTPLLLWISHYLDFQPIENLWDELEEQDKDLMAHKERKKFTELRTA
ncbi:hypothetical protein TELCIR_06166 [Teladorsagia circumcincta]|uniref:Uncharacterized protein n=1 Tax=Teladorsagia circumcincta TaxID=45464 RepID=A0A2G9UNY0_TELCI|nr:hypothetical protein TELCIR_06166 [Teladorsagia circumcincta]